jgi:hypothetical protein
MAILSPVHLLKTKGLFGPENQSAARQSCLNFAQDLPLGIKILHHVVRVNCASTARTIRVTWRVICLISRISGRIIDRSARTNPAGKSALRAIFISYRRDDTEGEAGRLFDDLAKQFGESSVFMDVVAIEVGRDFRKAIDESVATCGVLLAVIGKDWLDAKNEAGKRRLDDPSDFVRLETASALSRDIPVIPVLVRGAKMPRPEQLPADLRNLAYRNGCELTHARWGTDLQLLLGALRPHVGGVSAAKPPALRSKPRWVILAALLCVALAIALAAYYLFPARVTVPDLTGVSSSEATSRLRAVHLLAGRETRRLDAEKAADTVLSQSPGPATRVKSGTAVDLVIAAPRKVAVPGLAGMTLKDAKRALREGHLLVGAVTPEPKPGVEQNTVLSVIPGSGTMVETGTSVNLVVSALPSSNPAPKASDANQQRLPFDGTWELFEVIRNGSTTVAKPGQRIKFTQNGTSVRLGNREVPIQSGTVTFQQSLAKDGTIAARGEQAGSVLTRKFTIEDGFLVGRSVFDIPGHPRSIEESKYRRIP